MHEFSTAVTNLRTCLNRLVHYRNESLARGVESRKDLLLPHALTCSNRKIKEMLSKMVNQYISNKNAINREIRKKSRAKSNKH